MFAKQRIDDAVSPVVGVILMVAVTVILAAVIGSFVLDLGNNVQANPQAGVTFDQSTAATQDTADSDTEYQVSVQIVSMENADEVQVRAPTDAGFADMTACEETSAGDTCTLTGVGNSVTVGADDQSAGTQVSDGDQITIVGVLDGKEAVLQTYTVDA